MSQYKRVIFLVLSVVVTVLAAPLPPPLPAVSAEDVHLNAVLPEAEVISTHKIDKNVSQKQLELQPEPTTPFPDVDVDVNVTTPRPVTYFSRVISSIFEIPIAVLTAVRNLIHTAAPSLRPPQPIPPQ